MNDTLIVVPARGGSIGIPRKAVRLLAGKSPLQRTLEMLEPWKHHTVVTTDDAEIRTIALTCGYLVVEDPPSIHGLQTWRRAVNHAAEAYTSALGPSQCIAVVQCTSPFLRAETIDLALTKLQHAQAVVTVQDDRHARIGTPRVARQAMAPCWRVTGGVTGVCKDRLDTWHVDDADLIEVMGAEALDLDTEEDWWVAERYAGATAREEVLTRVLAGPTARGVIALFSSWDEVPEEAKARQHVADSLTHCWKTRTIELHDRNTYAEAVQLMNVVSPDERDVVLVTSSYHQLRACLTVLRVLQQRGQDRTVRLWNAPAMSGLEKTHQEWAKITAYQAQGDVATFEAALQYLEWRDACVT